MKTRILCMLVAVMMVCSVCVSAAEAYITPMTSQKVTWTQSEWTGSGQTTQGNCHLAGSKNSKAPTAGYVADDGGCFYFGDTNTGYGFGFGSDIVKKNEAGATLPLCGKGVLTFDIKQVRPSSYSAASNKTHTITIQGLVNGSAKTIGEIQMVGGDNGTYTVRAKNAETTVKWINAEFALDFEKWYTFKLEFDVANRDYNIYMI